MASIIVHVCELLTIELQKGQILLPPDHCHDADVRVVVDVGLVDPLPFGFTVDAAHEVASSADDLQAGVVLDFRHEELSLVSKADRAQLIAPIVQRLRQAIELEHVVKGLAVALATQNYDFVSHW